MQIHGPSEQPASIGVRLNPGANGPFAVVDFGSTRIYVESIADADMLIKAAIEARSLLLGETTAQDDAGRAIVADLDADGAS